MKRTTSCNAIRPLPMTVFRAALYAALLGCLIWKLLAGQVGHMLLCLLTVFLVSVPALCQLLLPVVLPWQLEVTLMLFAAAANILGEMLEFYLRFPFWDTLLHILWGFLAAAIGYSLPDLLGKGRHRSGEGPVVLAVLFVLSFASFSGVLWEFFERFMDVVFHMDMQKDSWVTLISSVSLNPAQSNTALEVAVESVTLNGRALPAYLDLGLADTMQDLFLNFLGSCLFAALVPFDCRNSGTLAFPRLFMPRLKHSCPAQKGNCHET